MTTSEQIDDTAETWFATYPRWIGRVVRAALPETVTPLAMYYSWEHDSRLVPALLVLPSALVGIQIEFVGHSNVLSVTRTSVGLSEVVRVSTSMRIGIDGSGVDAYPVEAQGVRLELRGELPPFGSTVSLPLSKNDYQGNWDAWRKTARAVADALLSLGMGTGPGA